MEENIHFSCTHFLLYMCVDNLIMPHLQFYRSSLSYKFAGRSIIMIVDVVLVNPCLSLMDAVYSTREHNPPKSEMVKINLLDNSTIAQWFEHSGLSPMRWPELILRY